MLDLQAICHAALLIRDGRTTLLVDPWITGRVFLGGWALAPPPPAELLASLPPIQHIYLTHEHPDHSHIASLQLLSAQCAREAVIHIPKFMTDRFVKRLTSVFPGRTIHEMAHGARYQFGSIDAWSYQYRNDDSTLILATADGDCVANLNDTFVKGLPLEEIGRRHPNIRTILSQFSVSNAYPYGYTDYEKAPESFPWSSDDLKSYVIAMLGTLKPKNWIPYQSFAAFCRKENQYLNRYRVSIDEISGFVSQRSKVRVVEMYPGDRLVGDDYTACPGAKEYLCGYNVDLAVETPPGDPQALLDAAAIFEKSFRSDVSSLFRRYLRPAGFIVEEDGLCLLFNPQTCRFQIGAALDAANPDVSWTMTTRQVLTQAFKLPWGVGDLLISGRMRTRVAEKWRAHDFRFWAVGLIRHTGYFKLDSCWFLQPRAISTAFRRRHEAIDIVQKTLQSGSFLGGNIEPNRQQAVTKTPG